MAALFPLPTRDVPEAGPRGPREAADGGGVGAGTLVLGAQLRTWAPRENC